MHVLYMTETMEKTEIVLKYLEEMNTISRETCDEIEDYFRIHASLYTGEMIMKQFDNLKISGSRSNHVIMRNPVHSSPLMADFCKLKNDREF